MTPRGAPEPFQITASDGSVVFVKPSRRRRRTVGAQASAGRLTLLVPASMPRSEVVHWADHFIRRGRVVRRPASDEELAQRADELSRRYLDGSAQPVAISWSTRQQSRWGSCTSADGTIRISTRLQHAPEWVRDAVIVHELAHLIERGHGPRFRELVSRYPKYDLAMAYLDGVTFGLALAEG